MEETAVIKIEKREPNAGINKNLRQNGYIPGSLYGRGMDTIPISVKKDDFRKSLSKFGKNSVFNLELSGEKPYTVIVKEVQYSSLRGEYQHVDFQQISLSEVIKADVPVRIIGIEFIESKRLILNRQIEIIPVTGLPQDIPETVDIDVTNMKVGSNVCISDIKLPTGITTEYTPEQVILSINESKVKAAEEESEEISETV